MTNKQEPILFAGLIIIVLLVLFISPLSIYSGSDFVLQKQQQQAMAQKYAFSQIQNNMTNKASVDDVETLLNKGRELSNLGKHQEAISYFDKALAIDPNDVDALDNKGLAVANLGKYQEAISYYDKALAIEPNDLNALINKGLAVANLGKYQEAISYYDKALAIDPNNSLILKNKELALANANLTQTP
jgi:tetratricopeptide (TPR) repeat protein